MARAMPTSLTIAQWARPAVTFCRFHFDTSSFTITSAATSLYGMATCTVVWTAKLNDGACLTHTTWPSIMKATQPSYRAALLQHTWQLFSTHG